MFRHEVHNKVIRCHGLILALSSRDSGKLEARRMEQQKSSLIAKLCSYVEWGDHLHADTSPKPDQLTCRMSPDEGDWAALGTA